MSGPPVTIVESGGIPVTQVESGAPVMSAVEAGGVAVTLTAHGAPVVLPGGIPMTAQNAVTVTMISDGYRIEKTGGGSAYNGAAVSIRLPGDFLLRIDHVAGSEGHVSGMTADPTAGNGYSDINFGIGTSGTTGFIYENNVLVGNRTSTTTAFFIRRVGTTLTYEGEGNPDIYTHPNPVSGPLGFRSSLYFLGETIEVRLEA